MATLRTTHIRHELATEPNITMLPDGTTVIPGLVTDSDDPEVITTLNDRIDIRAAAVAPVKTVNGAEGAVTLDTDDVPEGSVNRYVRNFADAAARTAAIPSPSEGMLSYLADSDKVEVHNGAAWVDIAPAPAVLQVIAVNSSYSRSLTGSWSSMSLSASITPKSATSTLIVEWSGTLGAGNNGAGSIAAYARIVDGAGTSLAEVSYSQYSGASDHAFGDSAFCRAVVAYGDTAERTFSVQARHGAYNGSASNRNLVIWEIA